jgi:ribose transport system substrate-binding protein
MSTKHVFSRREVLRGSLYGGLGLAAGSFLGAACTPSATATPAPATEAATQAATEAVVATEAPTQAPTQAPVVQAAALEFAVVGGVWNIGWWIDPRLGWTAAAKELNINITEVGPVDFNGADQATMMEQTIGSKPDAIIMTPLDPDQLIDPCRKATEAGIPVMIFNSDIRDTRWRLGLIGMQNFNGGYLQGKYVTDTLLKGEKAKALIMTIPGVENHESRKAGVMKAFEEAGTVEVVEVVNDQADYTVGPQVATAALQANPDINLIVATDATGGESASRAVTEMGRAGEILIMGMDRDDSMLKFIKDGTMAATAVQRNALELYLATVFMFNHIKGTWVKNAFPSAPDSALLTLPPQVPPLTDTGVMFCTPENVDLFFHEKPA